jgi:hypothetical protein
MQKPPAPAQKRNEPVELAAGGGIGNPQAKPEAKQGEEQKQTAKANTQSISRRGVRQW